MNHRKVYHYNPKLKERARQRKIEELGIQFLHFNDLDVQRNMPGVLHVIEQWIEEHTPDPSREGN